MGKANIKLCALALFQLEDVRTLVIGCRVEHGGYGEGACEESDITEQFVRDLRILRSFRPCCRSILMKGRVEL